MSQVAAVGEGNFQSEVVQANVPVVVDFWAERCEPCKMLAPLLERVAQKYEGRLKVMKCNIDENEAFASQFSISSIPNLLFFRDGQVVNQAIGYMNETSLSDTINEVLEA